MKFPQISLCVNTFYEGTDDAAKAAADKAAADKAAADKAATEKPGNSKTYTQEEFERAIAAEKNRADESARKAITELEQHKQNANLSDSEKQRLQKQIDELNTQFMTKEEMFKREKDKLLSTHDSTVKTLASERDSWKNRYIKTTAEREIKDAAIKHDGQDSDVFLSILQPLTNIVEEKDDNGELKGIKVRIKLPTTDKNGAQIIMDLSPDDAVKQLKDMPEKGFLFKGYTNAGVGAEGSQSMKHIDVANLTPEQYIKHRERILK